VSAKHVYMLVCDGDGCTASVLTPHERAHIARETTVHGRRWTTRFIPGEKNGRSIGRSIDLCPTCTATTAGRGPDARAAL
jgi:hypothetical protein